MDKPSRLPGRTQRVFLPAIDKAGAFSVTLILTSVQIRSEVPVIGAGTLRPPGPTSLHYEAADRDADAASAHWPKLMSSELTAQRGKAAGFPPPLCLLAS